MKKMLMLSLLLLCACAHPHQPVVEPEPAEPAVDYNHLAGNVSIKEKTAEYIVYQYQNVRIDEVAGVAAIYCHTQSGKKAYLREVLLHKNHTRFAVFDCINLQ